MSNSVEILHRLIELDYQGDERAIDTVVKKMTYSDLAYLSAMFKRLADKASKKTQEKAESEITT